MATMAPSSWLSLYNFFFILLRMTERGGTLTHKGWFLDPKISSCCHCKETQVHGTTFRGNKLLLSLNSMANHQPHKHGNHFTWNMAVCSWLLCRLALTPSRLALSRLNRSAFFQAVSKEEARTVALFSSSWVIWPEDKHCSTAFLHSSSSDTWQQTGGTSSVSHHRHHHHHADY